MTYIEDLISHLSVEGVLDSDVENAIRDYAEMKWNEKQNIPDDALSFGKFKGKTIKEVASFQPSYLNWVLRQSWLREETAELIKDALKNQ